MNEVGRRIIANAAASKRQRGISKSRRFHPRQPNVYGLRLHVQALLSNAGSVGPQKLVRLRRAIAANDLYFTVWAATGSDQVEKHVEETRNKVMHIASKTIAQESVQLR